MATIATVNVQNFVPLARTVHVTTVIPLPDRTLAEGNTSFELRAVNAKGAPVRVQYHPFGALVEDGGVYYYKYARVIFECDMLAGSEAVPAEKTVTIEDTAVAPTAFTIHPSVVAALADTNSGFNFRVYSTGGFHVPGAGSAPDPKRTPEGIWQLDFYIADAEIIDAWKDPTNCIVRRYRIRTRATGSQHAALWWGELTLEIGHQNRIAQYWLEFGNSLIDSDTAPIYGNSNPIVEMYTQANSDPGDHFVMMDVQGPKIYVNHAAQKVMEDSGFTDPDGGNWRSQRVLFDPDVPLIPRVERWVDGASMRIKGVMCFERGTPTAPEQASMDAEATGRVHAIALTWPTSNKWGVLGTVPPIPNNSRVFDATTAKAACKAMEEQDYASSMSAFSPPNPLSFGGARYGLNAVPGSGGTQADFSYIPKGWPWLVSGHARNRVQEYWVYQEGLRPSHFRTLAVEPMDPRDFTGNDPGRWTDVFIWDGRPFVGNGGGIQPLPFNANILGKRGRIGYESWGELFWPDNQHASFNNMIGYFLQSGDWGTWTYLDITAKVLLAQYQVPSLGGERYGSIDTYNAARAFGRSVMALLGLYDVLGDTDLRDRAYAKYNENVKDQWIGIENTPQPLIRSMDGVPGLGECRNLVNGGVGGGDSFIPWQQGIKIVGLLYLSKFYPTDTDLLDELQMYVRSSVLYVWQKPGAGVNVGERLESCFGGGIYAKPFGEEWLMPKAINRNPQGKNFGDPVNQGEMRANQVDWDSETELWNIVSPVLGWEYASDGSDPELASKCKLMCDELIPNTPAGEEERVGRGGFGNYPSDNIHEFIYVIPQAIKNRETGTKELNTRGMIGEGDVGIQLQVMRQLEGPDTGNSGGLEGSQLRTISSGGGVFIALEYNENDSVGDLDGTELTIGVPPVAAELIAEINGTSSLSLTLGRSADVPISVTMSGTSSLTGSRPSYTRRVQDIYLANGLTFTAHLVRVTIGDAVINENESFKMFAGNSLGIECEIVDQNGDSVNLSDVTGITWILVQADGTIVTKTLSSGITVTSPAAGQFTIYLDPEDTEGRAGEHDHECQIVFGTTKYTAFRGMITVKPTLI